MYQKIDLPAQRISPPMMTLTGKTASVERKRYPVPRKRDGFRVTALCTRKNTAAADFVEVPKHRGEFSSPPAENLSAESKSAPKMREVAVLNT